MKYKLSLHSHTSDFAHLVFFTINKKYYLKKLLSTLFKKSTEKTLLVLGITNSNDNRHYEQIVSLTKSLPKTYRANYAHKDYFVSLEYKNRKIYLIKTDEIGTDKGHILIVGFKGRIKKRSLKEILKEAKKQKCVIIANHPLHEFHVPHFLLEKIFGLHRSIGLTKSELKKYQKSFDAVELNSYFPEDWERIKQFAKKNKLPFVSDSDAHFIDEIFKSWYETSDLDFSSPRKFKKALKKSLKKGLHLHAQAHGFAAKYKHVLQILLEGYGKKLNIIKTE
ncbi:MAG: PHP-associated domain-containing protein [Nanoarchaeota archaeon]